MWRGFLRCLDWRFISLSICGLFLIPIFFFSFYSPQVVEGASDSLILLYPPNNALINREDVEVIGYVTEPGVKEVTVNFKKGKREERVAVERGVFSKLTKLDKGINEIRVNVINLTNWFVARVKAFTLHFMLAREFPVQSDRLHCFDKQFMKIYNEYANSLHGTVKYKDNRVFHFRKSLGEIDLI